MKLLDKLKERKTIVLEEPLIKKFGNPEFSLRKVREELKSAAPTKVYRIAGKLKKRVRK